MSLLILCVRVFLPVIVDQVSLIATDNGSDGNVILEESFIHSLVSALLEL